MSKKKAGIITASVLAAGLAIGGVTTGVVLANRPLSVTYYANNGTPAVTTQVNKNETLNLPTPTREGYNFAGWYTDIGLTNQVTKSTKLKNNSKLYAGWELANYETAASGEDEAAPLAETTGLKSIGAYAFANSKISRVSLPNTVTSIDEGAFSNCSNLTEVTIPSSVKTIGERAFVNCTELASLTINYPVTTIGEGAFAFCKKLSSVTFNATVTNINAGAFAFCDNLTTITFSAAATNIGNYAFAQTHATTIKVPSLATWCAMGFASADANPLTGNAKLVVNNADFNLTGTLEIPSSVTKIGSYAFANCTSVKCIIIPETVTTIGANAFGGISSTTGVICRADTKPAGWNNNWNNYDNINKLQTVWGISSIASCSWDKIKQVSKLGFAPVVFRVGDEKVVTINDTAKDKTFNLTMQIAGFNHDVDASGNTIGITWVTKELLPSAYTQNMNKFVNGNQPNAGGWNACDMRTYLNGDIYNLLPEDLKASITSAAKKSTSGNGSSEIITSEDKLFLLSCSEININTSSTGYKDEGTPYALYANWPTSTSSNSYRVKRYADSGSANGWWLRSPQTSSTIDFCYVYSDGQLVTTFTGTKAICFAFCI